MKKKKYLFYALVLPIFLVSQLSSQFVSAEDRTTSQTTEVTTTLVAPLSTTEVQTSSTQELQTELTTEAPTTEATTEEELEAESEAASGSIPIYRLYNPSIGKHLYTTDANEKKVLYEERGWGYEGIGWYAPKSGKAVYRLYNPVLKNHLYTTDTNEIKVLTSHHGWLSDNNGKAVFYSGGKINIYRLYNAGLNGRHHWTTDTNEYKVLPSHGWSQEGVKFSAVQIGKPVQTQFYGIYPNPKLKYADAASLAYERLLEEYAFTEYRFDYSSLTKVPSYVYDTLSFVMLHNTNEVYFSYMDLDKNGTKELILRRWMNGGSQYDIYTYSGGKVVFLTKHFNHYEGGLSRLATDGMFVAGSYNGVSGGEVKMSSTFYQLKNSKLVILGKYLVSYGKNGKKTIKNEGPSKLSFDAMSNNLNKKTEVSSQLSWRKLKDGYKAVGYRKVNLSGNSWASLDDVLSFYENYMIANPDYSNDIGIIRYGYVRRNWKLHSNSGNTMAIRYDKVMGIGGLWEVQFTKYPEYVLMTEFIGNGGQRWTKISRSNFKVIERWSN